MWKAKDELGIWDSEGIHCDWPRKKDEEPEEHKERIVETWAEIWRPWVEEWKAREIPGFLGLYSDPGWGKTLCLGGLAAALYDVTELPSLFADWDTDGAAALPKSLVVGEE